MSAGAIRRGGVGLVGQVHAGADAAGLDVEGQVLRGDGDGDDVGDECRDRFAGDLLQHGDGLQVGPAERPAGDGEHNQAGEEQRREGDALPDLSLDPALDAAAGLEDESARVAKAGR